VSGESPEQSAQGNSPDAAIPRQPDTELGLVIYPITSREEWIRTTSRQDIECAIEEAGLRNLLKGDSEYQVRFSPGVIRVSKSRRTPIEFSERTPKPRSTVLGWSAKSRTKMLERFASLDYGPFNSEGTIIAFLTLTYPSDWEVVAPDFKTSKRHLQSLRKRFEREFQRPFSALWKMEFQRRGAPHYHLLCSIPVGNDFREWLSRSWAEIVAHPNPTERAKHLLAGTGVDKAKGIAADSPQKISFYFSKHASTNGGSKEYQNEPPTRWIEAGGSGRFWGYWALEVATVAIKMREKDALLISRILRRWQRSKRRVLPHTVWRTCLKTGVIKKRTVRRRQKIYKGAQSFRLFDQTTEFIHAVGKLAEP